jgi:hypothetical protein
LRRAAGDALTLPSQYFGVVRGLGRPFGLTPSFQIHAKFLVIAVISTVNSGANRRRHKPTPNTWHAPF